MSDAPHRRRSLDRGVVAAPSPSRRVAPIPPKRRRGDPLWAKLVIVLGALLMTTSGGLMVGGRILLNQVSSNIGHDNLLGEDAAKDDKGRASIGGPINLLLVGIDERTATPAFGMHADSIIIVHVPATHDRAYLVSIPRDSYVDIPAFPTSRFSGTHDKITTAFFFGSQNNGGRSGGFQLLVKTIRQLTGIRPNGGAIVNFAGFSRIVDAIGGVNMCVDEEVRSIHKGYDKKGQEKPPFHINSDGTVGAAYPGVTPLTYHVGCQYMESWKALDYCRQRDLLANGDSDYGRQRHQQQFIKAVAKKTASSGVLTNPLKVRELMKAVGTLLTFDGGGVGVDDWVFTLKGIDAGNLVMIKTNAGKFNSRQLPNGQLVEDLSPTSLELFQAVKDDKVDQFALQHPDWISHDAG